jgi:hypothetical protein
MNDVKIHSGMFFIALDPSRSIYTIANPIIVKTEFRRKLEKVMKAVWASIFIISGTETKADLI